MTLLETPSLLIRQAIVYNLTEVPEVGSNMRPKRHNCCNIISITNHEKIVETVVPLLGG